MHDRLPLPFDFAPYRLSGLVVGALLNHAPQLAALGEAVHQPPYRAPPRAPVLQVKPRHTLALDGDAIVVPADASALEVGATLGIVIGRVACRVSADAALGVIAGYTIVHDVGVPVASHYRPAARLKARDGFCPVGPRVVPASAIADPDTLAVRVRIDGEIVQRTSTGERVRGVASLIADVSEFMTLQPGDLLLLGASHGAPRLRAGQRVASEIDGIGVLANRVVAEEAGA